jgi:hypothetical protein
MMVEVSIKKMLKEKTQVRPEDDGRRLGGDAFVLEGCDERIGGEGF